MARRVKERKLETRQARRELKARGKPYWRSIGRGLHVGYRKGKTGGVWVVRRYLGGQSYSVKTIAQADDVEDSNGKSILDFWKAQELARSLRPSSARFLSNFVQYTGMNRGIPRRTSMHLTYC
jgi:hypothetical protein